MIGNTPQRIINQDRMKIAVHNLLKIDRSWILLRSINDNVFTSTLKHIIHGVASSLLLKYAIGAKMRMNKWWIMTTWEFLVVDGKRRRKRMSQMMYVTTV
mmetsp:Transcript_13667/g.24507  ORF Transcript_13667/g.24507 Transcript_13667/m.24507 type:complete len:100 (-) Transcript_13667:370-669(-)